MSQHPYELQTHIFLSLKTFTLTNVNAVIFCQSKQTTRCETAAEIRPACLSRADLADVSKERGLTGQLWSLQSVSSIVFRSCMRPLHYVQQEEGGNVRYPLHRNAVGTRPGGRVAQWFSAQQWIVWFEQRGSQVHPVPLSSVPVMVKRKKQTNKKTQI